MGMHVGNIDGKTDGSLPVDRRHTYSEQKNFITVQAGARRAVQSSHPNRRKKLTGGRLVGLGYDRPDAMSGAASRENGGLARLWTHVCWILCLYFGRGLTLVFRGLLALWREGAGCLVGPTRGRGAKGRGARREAGESTWHDARRQISPSFRPVPQTLAHPYREQRATTRKAGEKEKPCRSKEHACGRKGGGGGRPGGVGTVPLLGNARTSSKHGGSRAKRGAVNEPAGPQRGVRRTPRRLGKGFDRPFLGEGGESRRVAPTGPRRGVDPGRRRHRVLRARASAGAAHASWAQHASSRTVRAPRRHRRCRRPQCRLFSTLGQRRSPASNQRPPCRGRVCAPSLPWPRSSSVPLYSPHGPSSTVSRPQSPLLHPYTRRLVSYALSLSSPSQRRLPPRAFAASPPPPSSRFRQRQLRQALPTRSSPPPPQHGAVRLTVARVYRLRQPTLRRFRLSAQSGSHRPRRAPPTLFRGENPPLANPTPDGDAAILE